MGIRKIRELAELFKGEWVVNELMPKVNEIYNLEKQGYLYRMCCIYSMSAVSSQLSKDQISQHVTPILVKACKDNIPNVKFCVAKAIKELHSADKFDGNSVNQLKELLKTMTSDSDRDVAYFATVALQGMN